MARIQLASNNDDIRGKIGNIVYGKGRSVHTQRKRVKPSNPQTSYQTQIRAFIKQFSSAWRSLTQDQITAWNQAALQLMKSNVFGGKYHTTGHKLFVAWNTEAFMNGASVEITDPFSVTIPAVVQISNFDTTLGPPYTMHFVTDIAVPANSKLIVEATPCISPGISNVKGKFRRIAEIAGGTASGTQQIYADFQTRFGDKVTGKKVFIRAFTTNNDASKQVMLFKAGAELAKIVK